MASPFLFEKVSIEQHRVVVVPVPKALHPGSSEPLHYLWIDHLRVFRR
jgi:hypothetical protein